jgi:sulfatase modifying factor 1
MAYSIDESSVLPNLHDAAGFGNAEATFAIHQKTLQSLELRGVSLQAPLGKPGGFGAVFAATDQLQRPLAVKVVKDPLHREARKRHKRESQVLSSGKIPSHLVPYCYYAHKPDVPKSDNQPIVDMIDGVQPYLIMSRIPGKEVHEYVGGERPLPMPERIELVERLFRSLAQLHEAGFVHGDPSPRNVLVEPGNQVRLIDLGGAREINRVLPSLVSTAREGGTRNYAPQDQLLGNVQADAWTDIHAMSAVAFDALTGQRHDGGLTVDQKRQLLKEARVPAGISRIVLKGLREPDRKLTCDPKVFATASEVVQAIGNWRRAEARRHVSFVLSPVLLVVLVAFGWLWFQLQAASLERQGLTARLLRDQIGSVSDADADQVKELVKQADELLQAVDAAGTQTIGFQRQQRLDEASDLLRRALDKRRQLEALLPRYNTLGEILNKLVWLPDARSLSQRRDALLSEWTQVKQLLDAGEPERAGPVLEQFAGRLIADWEAIERARSAATTRAEFERLLASVPERLRSATRYGELKADGDQANAQWNAADTVSAFELADTSYGSVRQRLSDWLATEETEAEKATRVNDTAAEVARRGAQLLEAQSRASALAAEIEELKTQITKQNKHNLEDRGARQAAEAQFAKLQSEHAALQAQLNNAQSARSDAEAQAAARATELAKTRSDLDSTQLALNRERGRAVQLENAAEQFKAAADQAITDALAAKAARDRAAQELASQPRSTSTIAQGIGGVTTRVADGRQAGERLSLTFQGEALLFRWCPAGTFRMGSPASETDRDDDEDQVSVTLSHGFWMMETECWQRLWSAVMGPGKEQAWTNGRGDRYPVYDVRHDEAEAFAAKLTEMLRAAGILPSEFKLGLPTEAQWEYATRAGSTTAYCFGNDAGQLGDYAWYSGNADGTNHPVGTKKPNAWGIHDGHGSVWEWCSDYYGEKLVGGTDPHGPNSGSNRVYRCGGGGYLAGYCRSAVRCGSSPDNRIDDLGFRLALVPSRK